MIFTTIAFSISRDKGPTDIAFGYDEQALKDLNDWGIETVDLFALCNKPSVVGENGRSTTYFGNYLKHIQLLKEGIAIKPHQVIPKIPVCVGDRDGINMNREDHRPAYGTIVNAYAPGMKKAECQLKDDGNGLLTVHMCIQAESTPKTKMLYSFTPDALASLNGTSFSKIESEFACVNTTNGYNSYSTTNIDPTKEMEFDGICADKGGLKITFPSPNTGPTSVAKYQIENILYSGTLALYEGDKNTVTCRSGVKRPDYKFLIYECLPKAL